MIKKIILYILFALIVPVAYICVDYVRYVLKPRREIKNIVVISERIQPGSARSAVVKALEQSVATNPKMRTTVCDVASMDIPFIASTDAPAQKPITDVSAIAELRTVVNDADGVIFVLPNVYNGYSAGIKNAIDVLWKEWHNKPIGFVAYSPTIADGTQLITSFRHVLKEIKSDQLPTAVYVSPQETKELVAGRTDARVATQLNTMVGELYAGTQEKNYFRQLGRSITDKLLVTLIKFMKKKKRELAQ